MSYTDEFILKDAREIDLIFPRDFMGISTTVTSPPYWKLKNYGAEKQIGFGQTKEEYLKDLALIFTKCFRLTRDDGSLWIVVDDYREGGVLQLLPWEVAQCAEKGGWILRDIIIWDKQHTLPWHVKGQMRNVVEYILFFTKSDDYKFNIDRIKDWEELSKWWVDFPERFSPKGKTPTNIWSIPIRTQGMWKRISEMNHHCPFPTELVARIIELTTDPTDLVFDPFAGSGVVLAQAAAMNRHFLGCDVNKTFIDMFKKSIKEEIATEWRELSSVKDRLSKEKVDFEKTIMELRALKFARQATKAFVNASEPKVKESLLAIICQAEIPKRYERKRYFTVKVSIVVNEINECLSATLETALERTNQKPLSQYEIKPELELISRRSLLKEKGLLYKRFYIYPDYKPRKHTGGRQLRKWFEDNNLIKAAINHKIPMLSNIEVDVAWVLDGSK